LHRDYSLPLGISSRLAPANCLKNNVENIVMCLTTKQ